MEHGKSAPIYISGKITGLPLDYARRQFEIAERRLRAAGWRHVINPMKLPHSSDDWDVCMAGCIDALMLCHYIYFMPNSEGSRGVALERELAKVWRIETVEMPTEVIELHPVATASGNELDAVFDEVADAATQAHDDDGNFFRGVVVAIYIMAGILGAILLAAYYVAR